MFIEVLNLCFVFIIMIIEVLNCSFAFVIVIIVVMIMHDLLKLLILALCL